MISSIELFQKLKNRLGEEETKLLLEYIESEVGEEALKKHLERIEEDLKRLESRINALENRLWWIVGLILAQWLSVIVAILLKH